MDLYRKVRLACAEGMSHQEAARHFGISRDSVRKMLAFSVPSGYWRSVPVRRPKLDGFTGALSEGWRLRGAGRVRSLRPRRIRTHSAASERAPKSSGLQSCCTSDFRCHCGTWRICRTSAVSM